MYAALSALCQLFYYLTLPLGRLPHPFPRVPAACMVAAMICERNKKGR